MFGSKKKTDATEATLMRKKQIETLKSFNQVVKEIQKDSVFEVPVPGTNIVLSVVLSTTFPNTAPVIYVAPPLSHPWVDPNMAVIGHPKLGEWNTHASLGKVVKEIVKEFKTNPPRSLPGNPGPQNSIPFPQPSPTPGQPYQTSPSSTVTYPSVGFLPQPPQAAQASLPGSQPFPLVNGNVGGGFPERRDSRASAMERERRDSRAANPQYQYSTQTIRMEPARPQETIPELAKLSNQELEELLDNDAKFEQFLQTMEKLTKTETIVKDLRDENERVAASILEREPELKRLQEEYEVQVALLKSQQSELEGNAAKLTEVMKKYSPQVITAKLQNEVRKAEDVSDDTWQSFSSGDIEHTEFVKTFIDKRKALHRKAAKLEMVQADPSLLSRTG